jgi:hypothetical protein
MQYYIVAEDPQTYLEFSVTFQEIDKRHVFPAKHQAEAMRLRAEAQVKAKQANAAWKAADDARKAEEVKEAAKKAEEVKEAAKKAEAAARQKKIDDFFHKQEKIKIRQIILPDKQIDLPAAFDICKNDKVMLCNMMNSNIVLTGKIGTVRLIVCEDLQRKNKIVFMVSLDDPTWNEQIAIQNIKREKSNKQTGYSRYGVLMKEHFFICSHKNIKPLVHSGNGASASNQQPVNKEVRSSGSFTQLSKTESKAPDSDCSESSDSET